MLTPKKSLFGKTNIKRFCFIVIISLIFLIENLLNQQNSYTNSQIPANPIMNNFNKSSNSSNFNIFTKNNIDRIPDPYLGWEGHFERINVVAYNRDGSVLASCGLDGTLRFWDAYNGKLLKVFFINGGVFAFSPDGSKIAVGLSDGTIVFLDPNTGLEIKRFTGHSESISALSISSDGTKLASGSPHLLKIWDLRNDSLLNSFATNNPVNAITFSLDGTKIAANDYIYPSISNGGDPYQYAINLWDIKTGNLVKSFKQHYRPINSIGFSQDGKKIVSGGNDYQVKLWDVSSGALLYTLSEPSHKFVNSVSFSPDNAKIVAGGSDNTLRVWDANTGKYLFNLDGHTGSIQSVVFSPDGLRIASCSWDRTIRIWDSKTGALVNNICGHTGTVNSSTFSKDGKYIATLGSGDYSIKLWDAATGNYLKDFIGHNCPVSSVAFSPDKIKMASGSLNNDSTIILWNIKTGSPIRTLPGHTGSISSIDFSPDGKELASGSYDNLIRIWDISSGKLKYDLFGHSGAVSSIDYSPDGTMLVSGSYDKTIKIWNARTGTLRYTFPIQNASVTSVKYSADGTFIAARIMNGAIYLWTTTGILLNTFCQPSENIIYGTSSSIDFAPDRISFAGICLDGTIKIWDFENNILLKTIIFDQGNPNSICFSHDGTKIVSGGWGYKNIRIYDVSELNNVKENKLPVTYSLSQNYPNPFNPSTVISFQLPVATNYNSRVQLKIYDILGREVKTLIDEYKPAGAYEITFDAAGLPGGIYFYKLQAGKYSEVRKMVYLK